VLKFRI